jgi:hypothetical protein
MYKKHRAQGLAGQAPCNCMSPLPLHSYEYTDMIKDQTSNHLNTQD